MKSTLRSIVRIICSSNKCNLFILDLSNLITSNTMIHILDSIHGIGFSVLAILGIIYGFQSCNDHHQDVDTFQGLKDCCLTNEIEFRCYNKNSWNKWVDSSNKAILYEFNGEYNICTNSICWHYNKSRI